MSTYYYTLYTVFAVLVVLVALDPNFARLIDLLAKIVSINYTRAYMLIWLHPKNPYFRWKVWRRSIQMEKELRKLLEERND
jgi:thioredoxin-related protein